MQLLLSRFSMWGYTAYYKTNKLMRVGFISLQSRIYGHICLISEPLNSIKSYFRTCTAQASTKSYLRIIIVQNSDVSCMSIVTIYLTFQILFGDNGWLSEEKYIKNWCYFCMLILFLKNESCFDLMLNISS